MLFKRISTIIFTLILMLGVTGCMATNNNYANKQGSVREKMIAYMENKYNDTFLYVDSFDGGFDKNKKDIILSSEKISGEIYVGYKKENGIETYSDNYTQLRFESETKNLVDDLLTQVIGKETIVTHRIKRSNNNFNETTSFEEFLKSDASAVCFYAVVSPKYEVEDFEKLKTTIKETFEERFSNCSINIYFALSEEDFMRFDDLSSWKKDEMKKLEVKIG